MAKKTKILKDVTSLVPKGERLGFGPEVKPTPNKKSKKAVVQNKKSKKAVVQNKKSKKAVVENKKSKKAVVQNKKSKKAVVENKKSKKAVVQNKQSRIEQNKQSKKLKLLENLVSCYGNVSMACENCAISRGTYYKYLNSDPTFAQNAEDAILEGEKEGIDFATGMLYHRIAGGSDKAIIFFLKSKGGFVETNRHIIDGEFVWKIGDQQARG